MRKSLFFMLGISIVWVLMIVASSSQESMDRFGYAETVGSAVGSLVLPWIGYGVYLFLTRKKSTLKKTSV